MSVATCSRVWSRVSEVHQKETGKENFFVLARSLFILEANAGKSLQVQMV